MPKSFSPIPSPVPLDVLAMPIDTLLERVPTERPRSSGVVTRLANVCRRTGIEQVWMLAIHRREKLLKFRNCKRGTADCAEAALKLVGCRLDMFPQLHEIIDAVVDQASKTPDLGWLTSFTVLMALAGIGDWASEPAIIAALAEHGLRPGMPLDELFVYDPSLTVSSVAPPQTITERVATFAQKTVGEAMPDFGIASGLDPTMTVADFMLILAAGDDNSSGEFFVRRRLLRTAAHRELGTDLCDVLGIREE